MSFWNDSNLEPKRKFKFKVTFTNTSGDKVLTVEPHLVKKIDKPQFSIGEAKHMYIGHTFFFPGKIEWKEVSMTFVDAGRGTDDGSDKTLNIAKFLAQYGYQNPESTVLINPTAASYPTTFGKNKGALAVDVIQLDSDGKIVEKWKLKNAFMKDVNWGQLDYSSEDVMEVTMKIRYDWAELFVGETTRYPNPT